jgi:hypothetical protein
MKNLLSKSVRALAAVLLAFIGLVAIEVPQSASALNGSMFDPGLIVSDSTFYDFGTMSADDIQRFLNSKVPACKDSDGGPACLKDYRMDTQAKAGESGRCDALEAKTDQSAAEIIFDVANACKINPKVLLVILQKEQGLVQAANPTEYMYRAALGYGCPDSKPEICGKGSTITGLFNQLYRGAGQLQWYGDPRGSFTYLKVGTNVSVKYYPDDNRSVKCGSKTFMLKSQATAALYYYTPFTPNEAALNNLYGTGDNCSAYGNRNFWRFYSDWFGSPIAGGFLVKTADSDAYLIVDEKKYHIRDAATLAAMAPLGPLGTVSQPYFDNFVDAGEVTPIVKAANQQKYLVAGGKRYSINSCALASDFGVECADAVQISASQMNALAYAGPLTRFVSGAGEDTYYIDEGKIHEILDEASVVAAGIRLPSMSVVKIADLQGLTWGDPIATTGTLFTNRTTGAFGVYVTGQFYQLDTDTATAINFTRWFTATPGMLSSQGLATVDRATVIKPFIRDNESNDWLLTEDGKVHISQSGSFVEDAPVVSTDLLKLIPTVEGTIASPALVKNGVERSIYFVSGGVARQTTTQKDRDKLGDYTAQSPTITLSKPAFAQLALGKPVFAPGSIVKSRTTKKLYLIDGWSRALKVADLATVDSLALATPRLVNDSALTGYVTKYSFSGLKFVCDGETFIPVNGLAVQVEGEAISAYPGRATKLSQTVCNQMVVADSPAGFFFKDSDIAKYYLVRGGFKRMIATPAAYKKLSTGKTKAFFADANLLARIPTGLPAPNSLGTSTGTNTAGGGSNSGGTGSNGESTKTVTYVVVAGDSLNKIAAKFSTTVANILATNKITNPNSISVGLKLTIVIP